MIHQSPLEVQPDLKELKFHDKGKFFYTKETLDVVETPKREERLSETMFEGVEETEVNE